MLQAKTSGCIYAVVAVGALVAITTTTTPTAFYDAPGFTMVDALAEVRHSKRTSQTNNAAPHSSSTSSIISYRTAKASDMAAIACLIEETFDDPEKRPQEVERLLDVRFQKLVCDTTGTMPPHAMIIAVVQRNDDGYDDENKGDNSNDNDDTRRIVGFMELGNMPSPISVPRNPQTAEWNGVRVSVQNNNNNRSSKDIIVELPYLGNLCVDPTCRRRGVGKTLVKLALKIATKWCIQNNPDSSNNDDDDNALNDFLPYLFLTVERDNEAAITFYNNLNFTTMAIPSQEAKTWEERVQMDASTAKVYLQKELK